MEELIEYILQFGHLNQQQCNFIVSKANVLELKKEAYFSEAGKIPVIPQNATMRYLEFLENYPSLANRVALSHIASYLGGQ